LEKVYFNLNRRDWSVLDTKTGLVTLHAQECLMRDVTFKVSERSRERVLKQRRRNVHAFAVGHVIGMRNFYPFNPSAAGWIEVHYNPYSAPFFVNKLTKQEVKSAVFVLFTEEKCLARDATYGGRIAA